MRKVFFEKLKEDFRKNKNIFILTADLGTKFFNDFKEIDPKRIINVGVAEANMIDIAAGLSMDGKNVYCYSIIPFLIMRALEQIRVDICYNNLNVKLLGAGGGMVYGVEGITHHAIEDIAIMRSLPNMTVLAPGDKIEAEAMAKISVNYPGPLYIRFGRDDDPIIHKKNINFKVGKGFLIKRGKNVCILATGTMLNSTMIAIEILNKQKIFPSFFSIPTIKPIDKSLIKKCINEYKSIFTVEEHNIIGGLGSAVSEIISENRYSGKFKRIGVSDKYSTFVGDVEYLRKKMNINPEKIASIILKSI